MSEWTLDSREAFCRRMRSGTSEAYVGALDMVVISKPFTPGEDAVFSWLGMQDDGLVVDSFALDDGRDLFLMRRVFRVQSPAEAFREHFEHLRASLRSRIAT